MTTTSTAPQPTAMPCATPPETAPGVLPWLAQYPSDLDDFWLEVRCIHGWRLNAKTNKPRRSSRYFRIRGIKKKPGRLDDHVLRMTARGYHVFLLRNPVYRRQRRSSKARDVARITSFALDLDGIAPPEALERIREAGLPPPSMVVFTGHGVHVYFFLRVPLSLRLGAEYLQDFVAHWSSHPALAGIVDEKVRDPARLLRLTSINYKDLVAPTGEEPLLEQWRSFITLEHLARVILDNGEARYDLQDLIYSLDSHEWIDVLARDIQAKADQDQQYARATRGDTALADTTLPSTTPLLSPFRLVSDEEGRKVPTPLQVPLRNNTQREVEGLDLDYIDLLVERVVVTGPKERHKALARLVAKLRKSYDVLSEGQKRLIHSIWYPRWQANMSGIHDEESSLQDFLETWHNLPRVFPGNAEWLDEVLADLRPHPLRALAKIEDERKIADVLWTGRKPDGCCFLSCRVAAKALGKGRDTGSRVLNSLVRLGIVQLVEKGSKATGHASVYRVVPGGSSVPRTNQEDLPAPIAASEGSDA